jgi:phage repressor protein C with HTH and peptisase S24 domain
VGFTLKQLAAKAGCAASYLSLIENGRRAAPPSESVLTRVEEALGMERGSLVSAAKWHAAPVELRREAGAARRQRAAVNRLTTLLNPKRVQGAGGTGSEGSEGNGGASPSLDDLYRSGELRKLIEQLAPGEDTGPGEVPLQRLLPAEVPLINSVAAGYPTEFTDLGYPARIAAEYVRTPDIRDPDAFAARVIGDSMEPLYREGDIVVFSPNRPVANGMDCFVRIEPDSESTFKRVYFENNEGPVTSNEELGNGETTSRESRGASREEAGDREDEPGGKGEGNGERIRLQPLNPKYPARVFAREKVAGVYAAVSVTRSV